jgi:hypothetical protein
MATEDRGAAARLSSDLRISPPPEVSRARGNPVWRLANILSGVSGIRLDHASFRLPFMLGVGAAAASLFAYGFLFVWNPDPASRMSREIALGYVAGSWLFYYAGISLVLGCGLNRKIIARLGEERALRVYNAVLGIAFLNQACALGAVAACWRGTMGIPAGAALAVDAAAIVLIAAALTCKFWATFETSLDTYYYNDMFAGRALDPNGKKVTTGPYRWFANPMYGVGNLQAYGIAVLAGSWQALAVAALYQVSIYAFYYVFERPFVARTYCAA